MRAREGRSNLGLPFCTNSKYLSLAGCRPFSRRQFACPRCRTPRCRSWLPSTRGARSARASPEIECPSGLPEAENLSSVRPARAPPPARGSPDLLKETRPSAACEKKEGGEIRRKKVLLPLGTPFQVIPKSAIWWSSPLPVFTLALRLLCWQVAARRSPRLARWQRPPTVRL